MGKIISLVTTLVLYLCFATIIAQTIMFGWLATSWQIDRGKVVRMVAVLRGDPLPSSTDDDDATADTATEQVSYTEIIDARAVKMRQLELREQALRNGLDQLHFEHGKLVADRKRYKTLRETFDKEMLAIEQRATEEGMATNRAELEALKPKQTKEFFVDMLQNDEIGDVVILLAGMPTSKFAKITAEFKTPGEIEQIAEVLRRIRNATPTTELVANARKQLEQTTPVTP